MRKLAIAAAVSLSLNGAAHSLGLGEIEMYSALNQSLDAEIAILSASEEELAGMRVRLASASAFARAGLVQLPVLSSVEFDVDRRPDGKPVVKLSSNGPVVEPFLNFLIEVEAPGSVKLVREYTVLLDPPSFEADSATPDAATAAVATYTPTVSPTDSDVQASTNSVVSQSEGVAIDLSDLGSDGASTSDSLLNTEGTSEVAFTETTVSSGISAASVTAAVDEPLDAANLFVPDDQVFANASAESTVVGSDGQVISLQQEFNTTPSFEPDELINESDDALADAGSAISLDNLGAQGEPGAPIFDNEFDSVGGGELIAGDELRTLVEPDATEAPQVDFYESTLADASQPVSGTDALFVPDSDAAGIEVGDLIDLSGIVGTESTADTPVVTLDAEVPTSNTGFSEASGDTYRVQASDTLWRIANERKARGVTPHQMMVSLLNTNPSAFVGGNMNRLVTGAVLDIPTADSQRSVDAADALAIVRSFTRGNATYTPPAVETVIVDSAPISTVEQSAEPEIVIDESISMAESELNRDLEDVNRRMELARSDLANETLQRDELRGRVNSLEDNMEQMKGLITLRENQLDQLQDEVNAAELSAGEMDTEEGALQTRNAIERKADIEKNLATARAEAQSIKLSSEEDALRAQLAALEIEKRDLIATSQAEKAELVRQSENEKTRLLQQAKAERERVMAELESEKARISREAEIEVARIRSESDTESQRLLSEAQAERDRLATETEEMQLKLAEMEAEKARLMEAAELEATQAEAEKAELQEKADEQARLAAEAEAERKRLEQEASKLAENTATTANEIVDDSKTMIGDGADKMSGLLSTGPLNQAIGDRKTILGVGAGLSLLGLLGAWAVRRRKTSEPESPTLRPRADVRRPASSKTNFDDRKSMHGDEAARGSRQNRSSNTGAAVAGTAAAAAGTAAVASRDSGAADAPQQTTSNEVELEDVALDDTITEAEVYLRYGLHGQAEDLLKTAIDRSPDNEEYHFKLLENYHDQKNASSFNDAAATFNEKFTKSEHRDRVAEMAAELNVDTTDNSGDDNNSNGGAAGAMGAAAVAAGAGVVASGKDAVAGVGSMLDRKQDSQSDIGDTESLLDQTIDPGSEFSVDELQATGDLNALSGGELDDQGGMALDDVDLASLDDDGTMNLEDIAGSQMSGADLGTLDLTNAETGFDDLKLDGSELDSTTDLMGGDLEADISAAGQMPGGSDEMETMLDLAKAYMDMGDKSNAEKALRDIAARGNPMQQAEAGDLLKKLS